MRAVPGRRRPGCWCSPCISPRWRWWGRRAASRWWTPPSPSPASWQPSSPSRTWSPIKGEYIPSVQYLNRQVLWHCGHDWLDKEYVVQLFVSLVRHDSRLWQNFWQKCEILNYQTWWSMLTTWSVCVYHGWDTTQEMKVSWAPAYLTPQWLSNPFMCDILAMVAFAVFYWWTGRVQTTQSLSATSLDIDTSPSPSGSFWRTIGNSSGLIKMD